jgi:hypothetical protein
VVEWSVAPPDRRARVEIPRFLHDWPVSHAGFLPGIGFALRVHGILKLGDLAGRPWAFLYDLDGIGKSNVQAIAHRLQVAAEGLVAAPPSTLLSPTVGSLHTPQAILGWLLIVTRPRQIEVALRYLIDRPTLEVLGAELGVTSERVRSLVKVGKAKAGRYVALVPAWPTMAAAARRMLNEFGVITFKGLAEATASELGQSWPAGAAEATALAGLLALHEELVILRRGDLAAVCRVEKAGWASLMGLLSADEDAIARLHFGLPERLRSVSARELPDLCALARRQRDRPPPRPLKVSSTWAPETV